MSKEEQDKAALREGDSWRARVFRSKDKLLKTSYTELIKFAEGKEMTGVYENLSQIQKNLHEIQANPDNEVLGQSTIALLETVAANLTALGYVFDTTPPEPAPAPEAA